VSGAGPGGARRIFLSLSPRAVLDARQARFERKEAPMLSDPLFLAVAAGCLVTAAILIRGISTFGKEGVENAKRANRLMWWRIIAQFVAVVLILVFVYVRRQGG
jgi:uncharacterized membrane protein YdbT with pleckstrin-like domain